MSVTSIRRYTIGGSEIAAAAGVHPYTSPVMLWLEKTGRIERPETEAMRWGKLLEPVVYAEIEARGYEVMPAPHGDWPVVDSDHLFASGHPDAFVVLGDERAILEVKTANVWAHRNGWTDDVPPQYAAQCQWYMHLTGLDRALLAVLIAGQRLELREVTRNQRAIDLLLQLGEEFYGYLVRDVPPAPDGSDSAKDALLALYPSAQPSSKVRLLGDDWRAVQDLRARREQASAIDLQVTELENRVKAAMGDAETALSPHDEECVHWRNVTSRRVDTTRLKSDRPDIATEYTRETTTRRFQVLWAPGSPSTLATGSRYD